LKSAAMAIPAMALLQQHDARRDILIEPAACDDQSSGAFPNWGCNRAVKTNRLVIVYYDNGLKGNVFIVSQSVVCRGCTDQPVGTARTNVILMLLQVFTSNSNS